MVPVKMQPMLVLPLVRGPRLAGSGSSLLDCLAWALRVLPFEEQRLVEMATVNPARLLGIEERVADAGDRVILERADGVLRVLETVVMGQRVV